MQFHIPQEVGQILDADPVLAKAFTIETDREAVRQRCDQIEARRNRGVRYSGYEPDPRPAATAETILERARESVAKRQAFFDSPSIRFLGALSAIQAEAEAARSAYCRAGSPLGAMSTHEALCAGEALVRLSKVTASAIKALADMQGVAIHG